MRGTGYLALFLIDCRAIIFLRFPAKCSLSITELRDISTAWFAESCDADSKHCPRVKPSCPRILFALQDCGEVSDDSFSQEDKTFLLSLSFKRTSLAQCGCFHCRTFYVTLNAPLHLASFIHPRGSRLSHSLMVANSLPPSPLGIGALCPSLCQPFTLPFHLRGVSSILLEDSSW